MTASRDQVFDRVTVDHVLKTGTRVSWRLREDFMAPLPYLFQLQLGETGLASADDWADVTDPFENVMLLTDDGPQRDFSVVPTSHYRVKLVSTGGTFYSPPVPCYGRLHRADWLRARAIVRREFLRHKVRSGAHGWLFKRRKRTEPVTNTNVVDPLTGEIMSTIATEGVGTDLVGGYFEPVPFFMDFAADTQHFPRRTERGSTDDLVSQVRVLAFPEIEHGDIWASATGDARYAVQPTVVLAHVRGVPIVMGAEVHRLAANAPIYDLPLPETPPLQTLDREEY